MTPAGFRRIALALKDVEEHAHHHHPDFRVAGRVFATLGYPDRAWGMVKLTPDQQRAFSRDYPEAFAPVKGAWGERGATSTRLKSLDEEMLGEALTLAWRNAVEAKPARTAKPPRRRHAP
ncbi:MAG TPA: MmcQ/YjbR family DNA-binding protein [Vicinamibacterales bacterium]|jgi:hypothetical protein